MMASDADNPSQKLLLINAEQGLRVALEKICHELVNDNDDLYAVSLRFRLLRLQGFKMSYGMKSF